MEISSIIDSLHIPKDILRVLLILVIAWFLIILSRKLIRVFRGYMHTHIVSAEDGRRYETLARVFRYGFTVLIWLVAGMLVLSELGVSIAPILGAAGVVGIAVGFAAKSLIQDYFIGIFLLLENQIRQGDAVEISGKTGIVEDITLRFVALRDIEGNVHYIPNGQITVLTNKSRGYAYALIEFGVAYREDLDEVYQVTRETAAAFRQDPEFGPKILEDLEIQGVQDWADSAVVVRCRFKTEALEQWAVRRNFLVWLKKAFDKHGIEIPYPHLTLYAGQDKQGNAPALRILQQPDE
ncbi:MAG: mechanosensitive ion channel family protein [Gammaproteobacteria bacterium]|nr:mechanosensitive ion channel family protein [Sideroxydans sp.]MBU3904098.1 mechanosensitive ion channel family protein [Gammaproteobacteria bacterium]MBU4046681.1 mechanosensitive ion channel family protein [Gammaproteobacteria bacterium]